MGSGTRHRPGSVFPRPSGYLCFGEQSPESPEGATSDGAAANPLEPVLRLHLWRQGRRAAEGGRPPPTGPGDAPDAGGGGAPSCRPSPRRRCTGAPCPAVTRGPGSPPHLHNGHSGADVDQKVRENVGVIGLESELGVGIFLIREGLVWDVPQHEVAALYQAGHHVLLVHSATEGARPLKTARATEGASAAARGPSWTRRPRPGRAQLATRTHTALRSGNRPGCSKGTSLPPPCSHRGHRATVIA